MHKFTIEDLHWFRIKISQSARQCRTVVRVVPISIGNGTFGGPAVQKPLNRPT